MLEHLPPLHEHAQGSTLLICLFFLCMYIASVSSRFAQGSLKKGVEERGLLGWLKLNK